ncbi:MAG TPA: glutamate-5-semialdehyde dehydrogenase [Pyrinomonadaceae bacterium]|nr:glutamate-5-semialdehyde dehydrogenase [Pyrinomonadaceae bacterium]
MNQSLLQDTTVEKPLEKSDVRAVARRAKAASRKLASIPGELRIQALLAAADEIEKSKEHLLAANRLDCDDAISALAGGKMSQALFDRLQLSERSITQMATGVREVAALPAPLGQTLAITELDEGLTLYKESCPIGVIGIIFEARPEIVPQIAALALKSGNAVILKGGSEAQHSNRALVETWNSVLAGFAEIPADAVSLIYTRADVEEMLSLDDEIDLIIPRGSKEFVAHVAAHSRIPVLGHGEGICHVFVDRLADLEKAVAIAFDSKVQYPAACNAMETLLVHQDVAPVFLPEMISRFQAAGVEVRGCSRTLALSPGRGVVPATEDDWDAEYSDLVVSIKVVDNTEAAIEHINRHGSSHTESIVTEDSEAAAGFMERVDAAGVYHNVSTRFADGFRYGFGAELGISTSKLHARGPVGLDGLTTYKYKLIGDGQTVASYVAGERRFKHRRVK